MTVTDKPLATFDLPAQTIPRKSPSESAAELLAAHVVTPPNPAAEVKQRTPDPDRIAQCANCGRTFTPARSDATYCGARCRQAAYRARVEAAAPKKPRPPLPEKARFAERDLEPVARKVGRIADNLQELIEDDRFPRLARKGSIDAPRLANRLERQVREILTELQRVEAVVTKLREP